MASVKYFGFPEDKKTEITDDIDGKPLISILKRLNVDNEPLAVKINGVCPDECDLEYIIKNNDEIEIYHFLEGGERSASEKNSIADVLSIAALVAISIWNPAGWIKAAVLIGSSFVSGALRQRAAELAAQGKTINPDSSAVDTSSNSYSITNISNEARPLSPMPLIMGEHQYAPDIYADAVIAVEDNDFTESNVWKSDATYIPGNSKSNGAHSGNWFVMPADFIASGLPKYDIKIMPYGSGWSVLEQNDEFINYFKEKVLAGISNPSTIGACPIVIYHSDPTDPFYKRYNYWHFLLRAYQHSSLDYDDMAYLFSDNSSYDDKIRLFYDSSGLTNRHNLLLTDQVGLNCYPSNVGYTENDIAGSYTVTNKIRALLDDLNGNDLSAEKHESYEMELQYYRREISSVTSEGYEYSTQVFNFGIGSMFEADFPRIGSISLSLGGGLATKAAYSFNPVGSSWPIWGSNFNYPVPLRRIRTTSKGSGFLNYEDQIGFYENVLRIEGKKLINHNSPTSLIGPTPGGEAFIGGLEDNYIEFNGRWGCNVASFYITGHLYATSGSGIVSNTCVLEAYWRVESKDGEGETNWEMFTNPEDELYADIIIQNDNLKKINQRYWVCPTKFESEFVNKRIVIKIRKVTSDSSNNENANTCDLYIDKICFYQESFGMVSGVNPYRPRTCERLMGVFLKSTVSDSVQTNKLSCVISTHCWVYNFNTESWSWSPTRNPAFWFLYFAHGGFLGTLNEALPSGYPYENKIAFEWYAAFYNYPLPKSTTDVVHIFGAGLRDEQIDIDKILEWAEFCKENELYFDMVLKEDTSCADVLERIANVGRASTTYINGKLSVVYEDPGQVPTCMFGMGNIKAGSFSVDYNLAEPVRKIIASYVDRTTWETETVESIVPYSDPDNHRIVEITMEGVTDTQQAQREVNLLAARQFFQRRVYSWTVDFEGLMCRRGDLVYLSHDCTQYGFSGRIISFNMESGVITSIKVGAILDSSIRYVTIRSPDGEMNIYECHVDGEFIVFDETYPLNLAPVFISNTVDNQSSDFPNSIPEDFIFIAGAKETPGKLVRISDIKVNDEDMNFTITALDEDPAMWAYEYNNVIPPESFDDVELVLSVKNIRIEYPSQGLVKIYWESVNGDFIEIINEATGLPIESSGSYSFSGGEVTIELIPNQKYILEIRPFAIGTPFKSVSQKVVVWPK